MSTHSRIAVLIFSFLLFFLVACFTFFVRCSLKNILGSQTDFQFHTSSENAIDKQIVNKSLCKWAKRKSNWVKENEREGVRERERERLKSENVPQTYDINAADGFIFITDLIHAAFSLEDFSYAHWAYLPFDLHSPKKQQTATTTTKKYEASLC